jgi:hypothetical protein
MALSVSGTNIFAGTWIKGVFLSTDAGSSWAPADSGLTYNSNIPYVTSMAMNDVYLFVGTTTGVRISASTKYGEMPYGRKVLASTQGSSKSGGAVWRRLLSEMITRSEDKHGRTPASIALNQNYPNPFNPSTVISYQLPSNSLVVLRVFDVLGRQVETLFNERQTAGNHSVRFDATDLPSGVYFYRLEVGTYRDTKKLLLLK